MMTNVPQPAKQKKKIVPINCNRLHSSSPPWHHFVVAVPLPVRVFHPASLCVSVLWSLFLCSLLCLFVRRAWAGLVCLSFSLASGSVSQQRREARRGDSEQRGGSLEVSRKRKHEASSPPLLLPSVRSAHAPRPAAELSCSAQRHRIRRRRERAAKRARTTPQQPAAQTQRSDPFGPAHQQRVQCVTNRARMPREGTR